jgi:hypothetical protein
MAREIEILEKLMIVFRIIIATFTWIKKMAS